MSECGILNLALWAAKGPVRTGSLGVMGLVVFGTAFVYHYDDHTASMQYEPYDPVRSIGRSHQDFERLCISKNCFSDLRDDISFNMHIANVNRICSAEML